MAGAQLRRPGRGDEASVGDLEIAAKLFQARTTGNALDHIHALIVATSRQRSLTPLERRIRCMTAPKPWQALGISASAFYRRKRRARMMEAS